MLRHWITEIVQITDIFNGCFTFFTFLVYYQVLRYHYVMITLLLRNTPWKKYVLQPNPKVLVDNMEARDCKSSSVASPVFSRTPAKCNDSFTSCTLSRNKNVTMPTFNIYLTFITSQFEVLNFFENFFVGILPDQICQINFCLGKWLPLTRFCDFF